MPQSLLEAMRLTSITTILHLILLHNDGSVLKLNSLHQTIHRHTRRHHTPESLQFPLRQPLCRQQPRILRSMNLPQAINQDPYAPKHMAMLLEAVLMHEQNLYITTHTMHKHRHIIPNPHISQILIAPATILIQPLIPINLNAATPWIRCKHCTAFSSEWAILVWTLPGPNTCNATIKFLATSP